MRYILLIYVFILSSCQREGRLPDMRETFGYQETLPFGGSLMYELCSASFEGNHEVSNTSFHRLYMANEDSGAVLISLAAETDLSSSDVQSIFSFSSEGNTTIIISGKIDSLLLKEIGVKQVSPVLSRRYENGFISLGENIDPDQTVFGFFHKRLSNYFIVDTAITTVLGYNSDNLPDAISFRHGNGQLLLFANPRSFSNYFLLTSANFKYLQAILGSVNKPSTKWYWDNFYPKRKNQQESGGSTLSEIMRYPALAAAFWVAVALLLIYILFHGKRRANIIPVPDDKRSPASFMETISELYIHEAENKVIAQKIINRFQDHIGKRWFFQNISEIPADKLSAKTGVSIEIVNELNLLIQRSGVENISNEELVRLEQLTQMFYNK